MKKLLIFLVMCSVLTIIGEDGIEKKLKEMEEKIQELKKEYESKILELQNQVRELQDKLEEKEVEQESLSSEFEKEKKESQRFRQQISRVSYLPDISVVGDLRFRSGNNISDENIFVNEIETAISGAVDPYFYYDSFITLEREESGEVAVDVEEAYVKYLGIKELGIRVGKFNVPITKSYTWHIHQRLFGEVPLYYDEYFNFQETEGFHIYYQIPQPIMEISFYLLSNKFSKIFNDGSSRLVPLISVKNFFPFSAFSDLESITTLSYGNNQFHGDTFLGANTLFFRWKNMNYPYNKIQVLMENIFARVNGMADKNKYANYTLLSYNFSKYVAAGLDFSLAKELEGSHYNTAYGVIFDIIPSDFSFLRFNYQVKPHTDENIFLIELNFGIGKHRAHTY